MATGLVERVPTETGTRASAVEATLRCFATFGASKTTLDDVAREAKCSRATLYRCFPGGKDELVDTVLRSEVSRFFDTVASRMQEAQDLEDVLVAAVSTAVTEIEGHAALRFLVLHEPELVWPHVAFSELSRVLALAADFLEPYLVDHLHPEDARRVGEWIARIVLSHVVCPAAGGSLRGERARRLVRSYVMPGIRQLESWQVAGSEVRADQKGVTGWDHLSTT